MGKRSFLSVEETNAAVNAASEHQGFRFPLLPAERDKLVAVTLVQR